MGKFRVPTLRNIALTAPYMHDGSLATLEEVIDHYARAGVRRGDGAATTISTSAWVDSRIKPFAITSEEKRDLIEFLGSLTDEEFTGH